MNQNFDAMALAHLRAIVAAYNDNRMSSGEFESCVRNAAEADQARRTASHPAGKPWIGSPMEQAARSVFPLLIEADHVLYGLAAPRASELSQRVSAVLETVTDLAGDIEAYGNTWSGGGLGGIALRINTATKPLWEIDLAARTKTGETEEATDESEA